MYRKSYTAIKLNDVECAREYSIVQIRHMHNVKIDRATVQVCVFYENSNNFPMKINL